MEADKAALARLRQRLAREGWSDDLESDGTVVTTDEYQFSQGGAQNRTGINTYKSVPEKTTTVASIEQPAPAGRPQPANFCTRCGERNVARGNFCVSCGNKLI